MRTPLRRWVAAHRHREQRGAVAILMALVTCFVVIPVGAMAIDLGMQRIARRDMQAIADTAALDAGRALSGCLTVGGVPQTQAQTDTCLTTAAQTSANLDKRAVGTGAPTVIAKAGYVDPSGTWTSDQSRGCSGASSLSGYFQYPVPAAQSANAVLVTVSTKVDFGLARAMGFSQGGVCRSSVSQASDAACFRLGSYVASINSGNSAVLGPLLGALGSGIDTNAVSYQGLASTQLSIAGLQTAFDAGSYDQLLTTHTTLSGFYVAMITALTNQGDTADATVLSALRTKLSASTGSTPITVGDLLGASLGGGSAGGLSLNALDLVAGAAEFANSTNLVSIPGLSVHLPGVVNATTRLAVVAHPKLACGLPLQATADTAQVELKVTASVLTALPNILGLGVSAGPITLDLKTAQGHGVLASVSCASTPKSMEVTVANDLLPAVITVPITVSAGVLGSMSLTATIDTSPTSPSSQTATLKVPDNLTTPVATGGSASNLDLSTAAVGLSPDGSTGLLGLVGITLTSLTSTLTSATIPLIESAVITPLLSNLSGLLDSALGLSLAGSDAYADSVACGSPGLIG